MSAYLDWKAGDKVVCIRTWVRGPFEGVGNEVGPIAGETYTIREIGHLHPIDTNSICVRLVEIKNRRERYRGLEALALEVCFCASRFRPVQKRTTSIEIFRALLNPSPEDREYIELEDLEHIEVPFQ